MTVAEVLQRYSRMETLPVTVRPQRQECGATEHARRVAIAVSDALGGGDWHAITRHPYWPHPRVDSRNDILILVNQRHLVALTHRCPAGTDRDTWTLRLGGQVIPHVYHAREVVDDPEIIARSIWYHRRDLVAGGCYTLGCSGAPLIATWRARSMCIGCARRYVETGR